jgi:hypothetical protein
MRVVFPAPLAPTKPVIPDGTDNSNPSMARVEGNSMTNASASMM